MLAGGGYSVCCTMVESIPVAMKLNDMGYDCFCINYRTISFMDYLKGLFPKPLDDLSAVFHFIEENNAIFDVDIENYYLSGFSAGGHLAALWATEEICLKRYHHILPKGILLGYPAVGKVQEGKSMMEKTMLQGMYGIKMKKFEQFNLHNFLNEKYPATYIVHCKDDETIESHTIFPFVDYLKEKTGKVFLELGESGNHGFAVGTDTTVEGWIERGMAYLESFK